VIQGLDAFMNSSPMSSSQSSVASDQWSVIRIQFSASLPDLISWFRIVFFL
jgi:hypothetical protein